MLINTAFPGFSFFSENAGVSNRVSKQKSKRKRGENLRYVIIFSEHQFDFRQLQNITNVNMKYNAAIKIEKSTAKIEVCKRQFHIYIILGGTV